MCGVELSFVGEGCDSEGVGGIDGFVGGVGGEFGDVLEGGGCGVGDGVLCGCFGVECGDGYV